MTVREGRYAAIDIGTVTCRMLVADVFQNADGSISIKRLAKEYAVTNLGQDVDATHRLSAEALRRVMAAIDGFLEVRAELDVPERPVLETMVVATSASRDAENAQEFVDMLAQRGLELAVIPGSVEASLSFMGASSAFTGQRVMVVDVGGGSTEVSIGFGGEDPERSKSFDVGCRRMTERFWDGYPPSAKAQDKARSWAREQFEPWMEVATGTAGAKGGEHPMRMIAVAGTATSCVSIRDVLEVYDSSRVHGAEVTLAQLDELQQRLAAFTLPQLESVVGLDPRRAPVIVAGMVILQEVMRLAHADAFIASEADILEGMMMHMACRSNN